MSRKLRKEKSLVDKLSENEMPRVLSSEEFWRRLGLGVDSIATTRTTTTRSEIVREPPRFSSDEKVTVDTHFARPHVILLRRMNQIRWDIAFYSILPWAFGSILITGLTFTLGARSWPFWLIVSALFIYCLILSLVKSRENKSVCEKLIKAELTRIKQERNKKQ